MNCYTVRGVDVFTGIHADLDPFARIVLGAEGFKRQVWVPLGSKDVDSIAAKSTSPCPNREDVVDYYGGQYWLCGKCGTRYIDGNLMPWATASYRGFRSRQVHPDSGEIANKALIRNAGILAQWDRETRKLNGKYLVVAPKAKETSALVHWQIFSDIPYFLGIKSGGAAEVIAWYHSWYDGPNRREYRGNSEILAVLKPGQELFACRSNHKSRECLACLNYDGVKVWVDWGEMY